MKLNISVGMSIKDVVELDSNNLKITHDGKPGKKTALINGKRAEVSLRFRQPFPKNDRIKIMLQLGSQKYHVGTCRRAILKGVTSILFVTGNPANPSSVPESTLEKYIGDDKLLIVGPKYGK